MELEEIYPKSSHKEYLIETEKSYPLSVEVLFSFWTEPKLLDCWLTSDCRVKPGKFFRFWFMSNSKEFGVRGKYYDYQPGKSLSFNWLVGESMQLFNLSFESEGEQRSTLRFNLHGLGNKIRMFKFWDFYLENLNRVSRDLNDDLREQILQQIVKSSL
jgi:uncharacterized protein YndB with AHSA1/START domain